jgi:RNA polymerase sigma-70 factor (ECF subfamily)
MGSNGDATNGRVPVFRLTMDHVATAQDPNAQLAAALATDLDGAFEQVVMAHQDRLFSIALRLLGDARDAEEVAQDAFVRAYRALSSYPAKRIRALALRAWLSAIVINLARNRRHRRPAPGATLNDEHAERDAWSIPHEAASILEGERLWSSLLAGLSERYRVPVVLRHVVGLSFAEMSIALDRPEGTLKAQVHRGLAQLRAAYLAHHNTPEEVSA